MVENNRQIIKRGSARIADEVAGEKFLIFDLTILKKRSHLVITKSKISAQSDDSLVNYKTPHDTRVLNSQWKKYAENGIFSKYFDVLCIKIEVLHNFYDIRRKFMKN